MAKTKDLSGMKFGRLMVLAPTGKSKHNGRIWDCICECGKRTEVVSYDLTSGRVKSCGCGKNREGDYTGVRRGDLTGVRRTGETRTFCGKEREVWEWRCACGRTIERALFQVYPRGISCCPECSHQKKKIRGWLNSTSNRVPGTKLTKKQLENILNGEPTRRNRSGIRGVSWAQNANKWTARGFRDGKPIHLGYFSDIEDAKKAREDFLKRNLPALQELEQIPLDQEEEQ